MGPTIRLNRGLAYLNSIDATPAYFLAPPPGFTHFAISHGMAWHRIAWNGVRSFNSERNSQWSLRKASCELDGSVMRESIRGGLVD